MCCSSTVCLSYQAYQQLEDSLAEQIEMYFEDVNRRDVIDLIQSEVCQCP